MDIPRIDISPFLMGGAADKRLVADAVADCCRNLGFLVIAGHGMDGDGLRDAFALTREFMDLPNAVKDRWHPTGPSKGKRSTPAASTKISIAPAARWKTASRNASSTCSPTARRRRPCRPTNCACGSRRSPERGYHGFATRGLASTMDLDVPPDLRETLFLGPVDDHQAHFAHLREAEAAYWPNTIPTEPAGMGHALIAIYRDFERLSENLLRILALALDLPEDYFAAKIDRHFSILSCHHYPALRAPPQPGQLRTGAHTDFGAMTILAMTDAATENGGGLEVRMPGGEWRGVLAGPGELVVNLGDMMARWTNDRWTSTLHRVANPANLADAGSRRQSIGYFMHPNFDARIECLPTCLDPGEQPRYAPITAGEHIAMKIAKSHNL